MKKNLTESELQNLIFCILQKQNQEKTKFDLIAPNVKFFNWESDSDFFRQKINDLRGRDKNINF